MRLKALFALIALPFALHLFQLFFLHYDGKFATKIFSHGFEKTYSQEVSGLDFEKLDEILSQPFHQLGQGKQMIAFVSADDKYVIKFFNPSRPLKKNWYRSGKYWQRYSSFKWISREWFGKKQRLQKLFFRHKLAYELLKEETGLVFVHLCPSKRICHLISVTDKFGEEHRFCLAKTPFVLQKKAQLVSSYLHQLMQENQVTQAKQALARIEALFEKRLEVGITDRIQTMENNYGFVDGKPIQIDVGRIRYDPNLNLKEEKARILSNFHNWIGSNYDHLLANSEKGK
ncbi:MAG: hypothetical protein KR126chlam3_00612 [Chlamydiae bacterium]|nr:hypothetical protein [Chlamydiota bacterium]